MTTPNEELQARRAALATPTPQAGEVSAATAGGEYVLVPMEPTPEMVREGIYNTNRKYNHNPVDEVIVLQVWSSMVGSRPVECIALEAHTTPTPSSPVVAQGDDFVSDGDALMRVYDGLMAEWEGLGRSRTEGSHSADVYEWAQTIYYAARRRRITAAGAAPEGWQPIETCPHGDVGPGEPNPDVLVVSRSGRICTESPRTVTRLREAAVADGEDCIYTHWQPLPATPNPGAQHGQEGRDG